MSEHLERMMVNTAQELAIRSITECGKRYHFDAEEFIREMGLTNVRLERKMSSKVVAKAKPERVAKSAFPLPYNGELNEACCYALRQNNGLYTQCQAIRKGENPFCKACQALADKSEDNVPEYGTIQQRQAVDIFEYVDPKGRKPVAYTKVMKKFKVTMDQVNEEAGKFNIEIHDYHFVEPETESKRGRPKTAKEPKEPKGAKGRPKKTKKVLEIECESDDLFATLVANAQINVESENEVEEDDEEIIMEPVVAKKGKNEEEKEQEKAAKEAQRQKEKEEKEAKKKADEQAKAEKKALEDLMKQEKEEQRLKEKAEKEAKKKADEEAKALKKQQEEEAKAAKALKKQQEEEAKAAKALKKQQDDEAKAAKSKKKQPINAVAAKPSTDEEQEPDVVKKIEEDGKKYLKSKKTGIIYDYKEYTENQEQVVVGKWNEAKNKIDFNNSEESEEEYESDDE